MEEVMGGALACTSDKGNAWNIGGGFMKKREKLGWQNHRQKNYRETYFSKMWWEDLDWIKPAQVTDSCRAFVKNEMNIPVP